MPFTRITAKAIFCTLVATNSQNPSSMPGLLRDESCGVTVRQMKASDLDAVRALHVSTEHAQDCLCCAAIPCP